MERTYTVLQERVLSLEANMNRIHVTAFVKEIIAEYGLSDIHSNAVADQFASATCGAAGTYPDADTLETAVRNAIGRYA